MMIVEIIGKDSHSRKIALLKCDECGMEHKRRLDGVKVSRRKRGKDLDVCELCSRLPKYRNTPSEEQIHNWKEGKYTHSSGYDMKLTYPEKKGGARYEFIHTLNMQEKIGRKLYKEESIHHIDCDKKNDEIDNLFLCRNEAEHQNCHSSMKELGYKLLEKHIYFNRHKKIYQLDKCENEILEDCVSDPIKIYICKSRKKKYAFVRNAGKVQRYHVFLIENLIGRKITRNECIHHIDGDSLNNLINNLCLMNNSEHTFSHRSMEHCIAELFKQGLIGFENGSYFLF